MRKGAKNVRLQVVSTCCSSFLGGFQVFVAAFYRQTPEPPSLALKQRNKPNGQQKPGKVSIFSLFYSKSNILFHRAILSFVILSSIQCLAERYANYQRPNV